MRLRSLVLVTLLVLTLFTPFGMVGAADAELQTSQSEVSEHNVAPSEIHVRTTFSLNQVAADEIRVTKEYIIGAQVNSLEKTVQYPVEDISTQNINSDQHDGETTFTWDQSGETARIEYVAKASDLAGPKNIKSAEDRGRASRGNEYAVVHASYDGLRFGGEGYTREVAVDGVGTAGNNIAVLGSYKEYTRSVQTGEAQLIVPNHTNPSSRPSEILDTIEFTDQYIDAGSPEPTEGTYIVVGRNPDYGPIYGLTFPRNGDVFVRETIATNSTTWQHEVFHQRKQSYHPAPSAEWTIEGNAQYYGYLASWQQGLISFEKFKDGLQSEEPHASVRLDTQETWVDESEGDSFSPYSKGGVVTARLDLAIRKATNDERTYEDVLRRLNDHDGEVTHREFKQIVVDVGGEELGSLVDQYATTEDVPSPPNNPYLYTNPELDSDISVQKLSVADSTNPGGIAYVQFNVSNQGSATSRATGVNVTVPGELEMGEVSLIRNQRRLNVGTPKAADYGYFQIRPGESKKLGTVFIVPENVTSGNYSVDITAQDISGQTTSTEVTVQVVPEQESVADEESAEPTTDPSPPTTFDVQLNPSTQIKSPDSNQSVLVFTPDQEVNFTLEFNDTNNTLTETEITENGTEIWQSDERTNDTIFPDEGYRNITVRASFADGSTLVQHHLILINDKPYQDIYAPSGAVGQTTQLTADVDNRYGNYEVIWLVDGERVATGGTFEYKYKNQEENVTAIVEDEYGAVGMSSRELRGEPKLIVMARSIIESHGLVVFSTGGILVWVILLRHIM